MFGLFGRGKKKPDANPVIRDYERDFENDAPERKRQSTDFHDTDSFKLQFRDKDFAGYDKIPPDVAESAHLVEALSIDGRNVVVSPLSLSFALGMIAEAGGEEARREIFNSGWLRGKSVERYTEFARGYLDSLVGVAYCANAIFVNGDRDIKAETKDSFKANYRALVQPVDFSKPDTISRINAWAAKQTKNKISGMLDGLPVDSQAVIANAFYFKSPWAEPFPQRRVYDDTFANANGTESNVPMMHDSTYGYYENEKAEAFSVPYKGYRFRFVGILPKMAGNFSMDTIDIPSLMLGKCRDVEVDYAIPEFEFDLSQNLTRYLRATGLKGIFGEDELANLIDEEESVALGQVIQKATVKVNREGTEASAASSGTAKSGAASPMYPTHDIKLDRPFAFMIYDATNKQVLFMGKVTDMSLMG